MIPWECGHPCWVAEGDLVRCGQAVIRTSRPQEFFIQLPAGGRVVAIHRGAKRAFQSLVIEIASNEESETLPRIDSPRIAHLAREEVIDRILQLVFGLLFERVPSAKSFAERAPDSIFINCMDTNPLALDPAPIIREAREDFSAVSKPSQN